MAKPGFQRGVLRRAGVGLAATLLVVAVCTAENPPTVSDVKATYAEGLMRLKGVFGVGVGEKGGQEALMIFVRDEAAKTYLEKLIRDSIEGHPVVIVVAQQPGVLHSSGSPSDTAQRSR
jgi:hypothetical protein